MLKVGQGARIPLGATFCEHPDCRRARGWLGDGHLLTCVLIGVCLLMVGVVWRPLFVLGAVLFAILAVGGVVDMIRQRRAHLGHKLN